MKVLHTIRDTPPNPTGLCALSMTHDNCLLAYPGSATVGEVQIFDADQLVRTGFYDRLHSIKVKRWVTIAHKGYK